MPVPQDRLVEYAPEIPKNARRSYKEVLTALTPGVMYVIEAMELTFWKLSRRIGNPLD